jgi:hypothetical protein
VFAFVAVFFIFQSVLMLLNTREQFFRGDGIFLVTPLFTLAKGPLLDLFIRSMVNEAKARGTNWLP